MPAEPEKVLGQSAVGAGCLWAFSVGAELVLRPQRPDGSVEEPLVFALSLAAAVAGSVFLVRAFLGLRRLVRAEPGASRPVRAGASCCVAGSVLLLAFAVVGSVTGLVAGAVWEPSFLAFALGMLLLLVGQVALGLGLRRLATPLRAVWPVLPVASACIAVAVAVPVDPWHDLGMFGLFASWVVLGARLVERSRDAGEVSAQVRTP